MSLVCVVVPMLLVEVLCNVSLPLHIPSWHNYAQGESATTNHNVSLLSAVWREPVEIDESSNWLIVGFGATIQKENLDLNINTAVAHLGMHARNTCIRLHLHTLRDPDRHSGDHWWSLVTHGGSTSRPSLLHRARESRSHNFDVTFVDIWHRTDLVVCIVHTALLMLIELIRSFDNLISCW